MFTGNVANIHNVDSVFLDDIPLAAWDMPVAIKSASRKS